jgi:hypothetical protein
MILKTLIRAAAVTVGVLNASTSFAQVLTTDWLITGFSFDQCMRHTERVFRETGFGNLTNFPVGMGGTYGPNSAHILCLPNKVVVFAVDGPDATTHMPNLKQTFVNLR